MNPTLPEPAGYFLSAVKDTPPPGGGGVQNKKMFGAVLRIFSLLLFGFPCRSFLSFLLCSPVLFVLRSFPSSSSGALEVVFFFFVLLSRIVWYIIEPFFPVVC